MAANISSLAKITDRDMLHAVIKAAARLMIQLNVPEWFLNPLEDPRKKTSEDERCEKVEKMVLP